MDADLTDEVEALIREHDALVLSGEADADSPTTTGEAFVPAGEKPGDVIGAYTLESLLGQGGFGSVWLAQQSHPVRRQVALKILKMGMDTQEVIARFAQERQALAVMDHPNIARVLDAGATPSGRPYFVIELVRGEMITRYCDEKKMAMRVRLELFMQVCLAVQHAHQNGIIHRDIKPSNILVSEHEGRPHVKVIDFGIAKATRTERLGDVTIVTQMDRLIGTPAYMSPEQIRGAREVDTRTDIYSLGVLLYELITSRTPFETQMAVDREEMMRVLLEKPAPKPSTRVKTLTAKEMAEMAEARASRPQELMGALRGDLDWIVMKALEKERNRRYDSADAFRSDVEHFLKQEPVLARPPTTAYLAMQFARRNRVAVTGALVALMMLVLGLVASTYLYVRESRARETADAEAAKSREVSGFLKETLGSVEASTAMGRDTTLMKEILDKTADRIGDRLANRPRVEAELRVIIGETYQDISEFEKAIGHHQRAVELFRQIHEGDHPDLAGALLGLGSALEFEGRVREAEPHVREALEMRERLFPADDPAVAEAHILWAWVLQKSGRSKDSLESAQIGFDAWRKHPELMLLEAAPRTLAVALAAMERLSESEAVYQEEWRTLKRLYGDEHPSIGTCLDNLGMTLVRLRKFDAAEPVLLEALAQGRKFYGDRCHHEDHILAHLAQIAAHRGEDAEQLRLLRDGVAVARRVYSEGHRYRKEALGHLVKALQTQMKKFSESGVPEGAEKAAACRAELEALANTQNEVKVDLP